jgi:hypothetical protein
LFFALGYLSWSALGVFVSIYSVPFLMIINYGNSVLDLLIQLAFATGVTVLLIQIGLVMVRACRRVALFPRTPESGLVLLGLGPAWRVATVQNTAVARYATPAGIRYLLWLAGVPWALGLVMWTGLFFQSSPGHPAHPAFGWGFIGFCVAIVAVPVVVGIVRTRRPRRALVDSDAAVDRTALALARRARAVFAPPSALYVVDAAWFAGLVMAAVPRVEAVIIDVSIPTEQLVRTISAAEARPCVFVCHQQHAPALAAASPANSSPAGQVARLIDGQDVLLYGDDDRTGLRRFATPCTTCWTRRSATAIVIGPRRTRAVPRLCIGGSTAPALAPGTPYRAVPGLIHGVVVLMVELPVAQACPCRDGRGRAR